jgi:hypothetical protein
VRYFTTIAHGAAGAVGARLSLRPLIEEGATNLHTPGETSRGNNDCRPGEGRDSYAAAEIVWRDAGRLSLSNDGLWL